MKTVHKRIIGLLMSIPGWGLLYLGYSNRTFDITMQQIIIFIIGALISTIIVTLFFYGTWLLITGPED